MLKTMPTAQAVHTDASLASVLRIAMARITRRARTEEVADVGVTVGQLAVLGVLLREGERTVGQLAAAERVQPPSMTRTVACLLEAGLVERHPHPTDGRQALIRLSAKGEEFVAAERRRRDAWMVQRLRDLTADERAVLRKAAPILERLSNA